MVSFTVVLLNIFQFARLMKIYKFVHMQIHADNLLSKDYVGIRWGKFQSKPTINMFK